MRSQQFTDAQAGHLPRVSEVADADVGLPCVIGTGAGTRQLRTGDLLRVDGTTAMVRVLDPGPDEA